MSTAAKVTLAGSIVFSITIVSYVHLKQKYDNEKMKEGIIKDIERQRDKKAKNLKMLQSQQDFEKILKDQRDREDMQNQEKLAN